MIYEFAVGNGVRAKYPMISSPFTDLLGLLLQAYKRRQLRAKRFANELGSRGVLRQSFTLTFVRLRRMSPLKA